jgi:hypothetical protein
MFRDLKHSPINFAADISIVEPKYKCYVIQFKSRNCVKNRVQS